MLYIFVEGSDDHNFFDKVFGSICGEYKVIEYAHRPHKKINNFIRSIKDNNDYLFFSDEDESGIDKRRSELLLRYHDLEPDKLFIIQVEIESWYYAGISKEDCHKLKMRKYQNDTNALTKEQFNSKLYKLSERKYIMAKILELYSTPLAKTRNKTFSLFCAYIENNSIAVS